MKKTTPTPERAVEFTRRQLLQQSGLGLGGLALAVLLNEDGGASISSASAAHRYNQLVPCAKSVIFLHMVGAPSQLDLFDYKPILQENDGKRMPDELWEGLRLAFVREQPDLLGTRLRFRRHGQSGLELSELLPHLGTIADDITLLKTVHTEQFNHAPAQLFFQTGFSQFGRPCLGSWVSFGLGSANHNLPTFVVMNTGSIAGAGNSLWGSGFLPTVHQGIEFRGKGDPVLFLSNPDGIDSARRGRIVRSISSLNRLRLADVGDPEIATRIRQYELAYRMQSVVPELADTSSETDATLRMYGTRPGEASFAHNCLMARRLVEQGVRFVQLYDQGWDHHGGVFTSLPQKCRQVDQAAAALVTDLKQRGLLDETLVIFGAEFGRTPMLQGDRTSVGRDHHKDAFCVWLAGGGARPGMTYGRTDELGFAPVENPVHVNDLHATILHLLGMDHEALTYKYQGREFRLTDVGGHVIRPILS